MMSPRLLLQDAIIQELAGTRAERSVPEISQLNSLAIESLKYLFDEKQRLFCRSAVWTKRGIRREAPSRKLTTIVLLGLQRLAQSGVTQTFDLATIQRAVLADTAWIRSAGDLGLLVWFTALCAPEKFAVALKDFDWDVVLHTFADARQGRTVGLTWLLTGIAHARQVCAETHTDLTDLAVAIYRLLRDSQGRSGLFGHVAARQGIRGIFSSRFGSFADQMFTINALVTFARVFDIDEPLQPALNCANAVCALQGAVGQWWAVYDKNKGCVARRYPLYAVHQHGIAPLALLALERSTSVSFQEPLRKGLALISAGSEQSADLGSAEKYVSWDRIELCQRMAMCWKTTLEFVHASRTPRNERLRVRWEVRPEHLGWLLYAFGNLGNTTGPSDRLVATA
jgi:hypothetical protein